MSDDWERTETERDVSRVLEEVAAEVGAKSIQAGMWSRGLSTMSDRLTSRVVCSRDRVRDAEGAVRVPYRRWTQGGAPAREPRGTRHRPHGDSYPQDRERGAVRGGGTAQPHGESATRQISCLRDRS